MFGSVIWWLIQNDMQVNKIEYFIVLIKLIYFSIYIIIFFIIILK